MKKLVDEWLRREWFLRESNPKGDLDVIDEVVTRDMYGMRMYAKSYPAPTLVLDVGAHIGSFSVLAKTLWPDVPVIAFEPNPVSFDLLKANTEGFSGVTCVNAAVSYGERPDLVYVNSIKSTGSGFVIEREKAIEAIQWKDGVDHAGYNVTGMPIECVTIEEYVDVRQSYGTFMKLDAELAEVILLNGLSETMARLITAIVGEYHCKGGWNEFLESVGTAKYSHLRFKAVSQDWNEPIGLFRAL